MVMYWGQYLDKVAGGHHRGQGGDACEAKYYRKRGRGPSSSLFPHGPLPISTKVPALRICKPQAGAKLEWLVLETIPTAAMVGRWGFTRLGGAAQASARSACWAVEGLMISSTEFAEKKVGREM